MSKQGLVKITKLPEDLKNFKGTICCYNGEWYAPADSEVAKEQSDDKLPPAPDGAVVLPVEFEKPDGVDSFEAWGYCPDNPEWEWSDNWGGHPSYRYAVPADSEIARINGVGVEKKEDGDEKDWAIVVTLGELSKPRGLKNAMHKSYYIESCSREEAIGKVVDSALSEKTDWYLLGIKAAIIE